MRYGLDDGEEKTLEEVGKAFNVSAAEFDLLLGCLDPQGFIGVGAGVMRARMPAFLCVPSSVALCTSHCVLACAPLFLAG